MNGSFVKHWYNLWFTAITLICSTTGFVIDYNEQLPTPALQARAQHLYAIIRCPTCNGQSVESSGAQMAYDLRQVVRDQLEQGCSDVEIITSLKKQYGESITFEPSINLQTAILWGLPFMLLLLGSIILRYRLKQRN